MTEGLRITQLPALPDRPSDGHKGTFGTVIVVGGSTTMLGAPALCAAAAFRAGAGLVKLAVPADVLPFAITIEPSATGIALQADAAANRAAINTADPQAKAVLAIGPGLGQSEAAVALVTSLLSEHRPVILDADALNILATLGKPVTAYQAGDRKNDEPGVILTPHPGEFRRLAQPMGINADPTEIDQRPDAAAELAQAYQAIVVLKGEKTVVSDGQRIYINDTGNPALATAGSGDVLTGVIASLIAQGLALMDAAVLGVHMHGLAADIWAAKHGQAGMTALELAHQLPAARVTLAQ